MKTIKLIASDFDQLIPVEVDMHDLSAEQRREYGIFHDQYIMSFDCPIARALKRYGYSDFSVAPFTITFYSGRRHEVWSIKGGVVEVARASREIANGSEFGEIEITNR